MFSGPMTVLVLVVFISPDALATTTTVTPSPSTSSVSTHSSYSSVSTHSSYSSVSTHSSYSSVSTHSSYSSVSNKATTSSVSNKATTYSVSNKATTYSVSNKATTYSVSNKATTYSVSIKATTSKHPSSTSATTPPPTTEPTTEPTVKPTTSPSEKTCAKLGVKVDASWNENFENKSSEKYKEGTSSFSIALTMLYNGSGKYDDVEVSNVTLTEKDKMVFAEGKLCLVFNGTDDDFIEDVFKKKVETGKLSEDFQVIKCSTEFEAIGVSLKDLKDWKAKEGECDKCEGAGGPFLIESPCEVETKGFSCKGLTTKESDDCVKYCRPSSSAATAVSYLILAIGIFLSFSFQ